MTASLALQGAVVARSEPEELVPLVGTIDLKDSSGATIPSDGVTPTVIDVDPGLQALVVYANLAGQRALVTIDTATLQQSAVLDVQVSPTTMVLDPDGHRVFMNSPVSPLPPQIKVVNLTGSQSQSTFSFPDAFIGQDLRALGFAAETQTLYAIAFNPVPRGHLTIHALDADKLTNDPQTAIKWSYDLGACDNIVSGGGKLPFVGSDSQGKYLYFACRGIQQFVGPRVTLHGVLRVNLDDAGSPIPSAEEFFPFSGDLSLGFAAGDLAGHRIFVISASAGKQKLSVFDARHRAWTGSVPLGVANIMGGVADSSTGRTYLIQQIEGVVLTDAADLPVPQGQLYSLGVRDDTFGHPGFDPRTRRLFIPGPNFNNGNFGIEREEYPNHLRVYEDRTSPREPVLPHDPDIDTHPPEIAGSTPVSFSALGSAFGARELFVGGRRAASEGQDPSGTEQNFFAWIKRSLLDTTVSRASAIRSEFQDNDEDPDPPPTSTGSECRDETGEVESSSNPGSSVSCDLDGLITTASTTALQDNSPPQGTVEVSESYSTVQLRRDPVLGMVAEGVAVARGISIGGLISIGEVRVTARAFAKGAAETADSTYETTIKDFVSLTPGGLSCGVGNDTCDPNEVAAEINRTFQGRIQAQVPQRDLTEDVKGSEGGAQAIVVRDPYYFWSEKNVNDDDQQEVPGLQLTIYNDQNEASRQVVQLAAVLLETHYLIGLPDQEPDTTGSLSIKLTDPSDPPEPLAGGVFEVYSDENGDEEFDELTDELIEEGSCTTTEDGTGDCKWPSLASGDYLIKQVEAPEGYFPYPDDFPVELPSGADRTVKFVNLPKVAILGLVLEDESFEPLSGGAFEIAADDEDNQLEPADQRVATCTTNADGDCIFKKQNVKAPALGVAQCEADEEQTVCEYDPEFTEGNAILVEFGSYIANETAAPPGYVAESPELAVVDQPFEIGLFEFRNGLQGEVGTPAAPGTPGIPGSSFTTQVASAASEPTVTDATAVQPNLLMRIVRLPAEALKFLVRHPLQAMLFALVWLIFGLPLWMARRRRLGWLVAQSASV